MEIESFQNRVEDREIMNENQVFLFRIEFFADYFYKYMLILSSRSF